MERFVGENGRLSDVFWEDDNSAPIFALEVVSRPYNDEYERKMIDYAQLGILYYALYAPTCQRRRQPLEVYRLVNGNDLNRLNSKPLRHNNERINWLLNCGN